MKNEFRIMRIGGIDIKVGWSLLIIGTFISLSLATGYFPTLLPAWGNLAYLVAALLSFLGLYASVLLHELAHAFVAQKQGLKVKSIVLNLFDGPTSLAEKSSNSRAEFWWAVVGPLTNLGLATVFLGIANLPAPPNPLVSAIALYLVGVNFVLGVLNLIPAYPLDGGQVLHALVWGRTKSQLKASGVVSGVGRSFGWVFIGTGFFLITFGDLFDGLWLMFLGWFLIGSARLSNTQSVSSEALEGVKVAQVMWQSERILRPQMPLNLAAQAFFELERERVLPVVEQGYLMGTLSLKQLTRTPLAEWEQVKVVKVMTVRGGLLAFRPEDDLQVALSAMAVKSVSYAAVIGEGGQFAGLFYLRDLPRFLEMAQLFSPTEPNRGLSNWPPTLKAQDHQNDSTDDKTSHFQPKEPKLDKAA